MTARPSLYDYVDVAERILAFHDVHPDGSLQTLAWESRDIGGQLFIVYQAAAYRSPTDARPGIGMAWEPFPGRTPYTHDSELMNAETAAWGRAIVAVGITASRKLASRQEVKARQKDAEAPPAPAKPYVGTTGRKGATDAQRRLIHALVKEKNVGRLELGGMLSAWDIVLQEGWMDQLTPGRDGTASRLIEQLRNLGAEPDVPNDFPAEEAVS
jgi:hypothetical protein